MWPVLQPKLLIWEQLLVARQLCSNASNTTGSQASGLQASQAGAAVILMETQCFIQQ